MLNSSHEKKCAKSTISLQEGNWRAALLKFISSRPHKIKFDMRNFLAAVALAFFISISPFSHGQSEPITLAKLWQSGEFSAKGVSGLRSMNDGLHYTVLASDGKSQYIVKHSFETGEPVDTLVRSSDLVGGDGKKVFFSSYSFNEDESKLLLANAVESIYRHSYKGNYYGFNMATKVLKPVTDFSKGKQSLASFSPKANLVAFVRDNNIYISDLDSGSETAVTTDGKWNHIINGAVDWVYEEEFSFHRGFYWSPEGSKIAYYRFDESEVPMFSMAMYGDLYPEAYTYKYPKAGERNSEVRIFVFDIKGGPSREVRLDANPGQYIPRIQWTQDDNLLSVMRMNRHQNKLEFLLANTLAKSADIPVSIIYEESSETYIDINDNLTFLDDGKHFVWNSERDGWNHVYLYDLSGKEVGRLTQGQWEVIDLYGLDQANNTVYFSAAMNSPMEKAIYAVNYGNLLKSGKSGKLQPLKLTKNEGTNNAEFSKNFSFFINTESNVELPTRVTLRNRSGEEIRVLEDNAELRERLQKYELSPKEFGSFKTEEGHSLNYWMIKPQDFDESKQYPAIFMVYGGPGKNTVTKSWGYNDYFWHQMLAQEGYVVISVDPRGTMYRGRAFKHSTYQELGKLETEDFISSARHFGGMDFIDSDRIGMMGWSYGGYMSSLCITKGAEYFKLAIAVAPVTNWRYYDTVYTERFMRTPQENASGYDDNSPLNYAHLLKGHYLLVHGAADDNVHYQNSMDMVTALVNADKQFDLMIYPNKNHGIYGGNTRHHLFKKMTNFITDNL